MQYEESPRALAEVVHRACWPDNDLRWYKGLFLEPSDTRWRIVATDEMDYLISEALEFHAFGAKHDGFEPQWPTIALVAEIRAALRTLECVFIPEDRPHPELPTRAAMEAGQ